MKTKRIIIWGIALLLLLVLLGMAFLVVYPERNRALVESTASRALGRVVRIDDGITLSWSMRPAVSLHGLWIGNPAWASGKYFARADQAILQFDILALLRGHLSVTKVELRNADIALESAKDGRRNWEFASETSDGIRTGTGTRIDRLVVEDSQLSFRPAMSKEHRLAVADLELLGLGDDKLSMTAKLNYRDVPFEFSANIDTDTEGAPEAIFNMKSVDLSPFLAVGKSESNAGGLERILSWELPPGSLPQRDAVIRLEIAHLNAGQARYDGLRLNATLERGHLRLTVRDQAEKLNTRVDLEPEDSVWRLTLRNKSESDLDGGGAKRGHSQGRMSIEVDLTGSGKSLASVIASARGRLNTVVNSGELTEEISQYLPMGNVLMTLLNSLGGEGKVKPHTQFECAVLYLDVADGIGKSTNGLALRSDSVNVIGAGTLNLANGKIDLQFKTAQRKGLRISILGLADKFIRLTGTLAQPRVDVNVGGIVTHGGAAWATGGLSFVLESLLGRLTASSNPCETVLKAGGK